MFKRNGELSVMDKKGRSDGEALRSLMSPYHPG
jgi:hypothetical protein